VGWAGILLGPEATNPHGFGVSVAVPRCSPYQLAVGPPGGGPRWVLVVGVGVGGCALFENYTVDASIFVVKLLRADGGCLGTRSR
jgi:hypothetical protein